MVSKSLLARQLFSPHLIQNRRHDFIKDHVLVSGRREHLVELIRLVVERVRAHRELHGRALDAIRRDHNAAVLAYFAVIAASTPNDDIDVGLFTFRLELALLPLQRRRAGSPSGGD